LETSGHIQACKEIASYSLLILMLTCVYHCAAHPNIRLFITHGGMLSSLEAIFRGVPVVGIPVYADQRKNVARAVTEGYGLLIDINNITTESLIWAIEKAIETPKYVL
jgi:glucuronosyltransferase